MLVASIVAIAIVFALILAYMVWEAHRWFLTLALICCVVAVVVGITMTGHLVHLS